MSNVQYPGTATLPAEMKQRVMTTFRHTLDLARQGNQEEANVGCDFILNIDPMFEPARQLSDKLRNPFSTVDLDALAASLPADDPLNDARTALAARDFSRALEIASEVLRNDIMNTEAQQIAEDAQSKLEAAPFIAQFTKAAETKIAAGNRTGAAQDVEKARHLDADHPMVKRLEAMLSGDSGAQQFDAGSSGFGSPFGSGFAEAPPPDAFSNPAAADFSFGAPAAPHEAPTQVFSFGAPAETPVDTGFGFGGPAPSFVVDNQPAAGGAPAADFGFTFEEEQQKQDAFGGGAAAGGEAAFSRGEANTFDFATASVETSDEDRQKVERYLADGDAAFDAGEYQKAIDTWSKIFLIDVTNDEASERIERARSKRQEADRRIEELMVAGTLAFEKSDYATARTKFEQVLALDPNHFNAREYLDRIEGGTSPTEAMPSTRPGTAVAPSDAFDDDDYAGSMATPLAPPEPRAPSKAKAAPATTTKTAPKKSAPVLPLAIVAALLVLGVGGYFVYSKFFSKSSAVNPEETRATFAKATALGKTGHYDEAIALLSAIRPEDPEHDRALEMIDDLKNQKAQSSGMINGRPAAEVFAGLVQKGRDSFAAHDYLTAKQAFDQASTIQPLPADAKQLADAASQQVAKLDTALVLLKEGKYPEGIANLEGLLQQDPENATIRQLLAKAHFNLGASALQADDTDSAMGEFDQVLKLTPNDEEAKRSRELAAKYNGQQKDLMYKIYVKYLPPRAL